MSFAATPTMLPAPRRLSRHRFVSFFTSASLFSTPCAIDATIAALRHARFYSTDARAPPRCMSSEPRHVATPRRCSRCAASAMPTACSSGFSRDDISMPDAACFMSPPPPPHADAVIHLMTNSSRHLQQIGWMPRRDPATPASFRPIGTSNLPPSAAMPSYAHTSMPSAAHGHVRPPGCSRRHAGEGTDSRPGMAEPECREARQPAGNMTLRSVNSTDCREYGSSTRHRA